MQKTSFEQRVEGYKTELLKGPIGAVLELAATVPGGSMDAPFAPIDPALYAAARQLVDELELGELENVWAIGRTS